MSILFSSYTIGRHVYSCLVCVFLKGRVGKNSENHQASQLQLCRLKFDWEMPRFIYCVRKPDSNSSILTFSPIFHTRWPPAIYCFKVSLFYYFFEILVVVPVTLAATPPQSPHQPRWLNLVRPRQWGGGFLNAVTPAFSPGDFEWLHPSLLY